MVINIYNIIIPYIYQIIFLCFLIKYIGSKSLEKCQVFVNKKFDEILKAGNKMIRELGDSGSFKKDFRSLKGEYDRYKLSNIQSERDSFNEFNKLHDSVLKYAANTREKGSFYADYDANKKKFKKYIDDKFQANETESSLSSESSKKFKSKREGETFPKDTSEIKSNKKVKNNFKNDNNNTQDEEFNYDSLDIDMKTNDAIDTTLSRTPRMNKRVISFI
jgi:hypothetical protein